jgi:integrase
MRRKSDRRRLTESLARSIEPDPARVLLVRDTEQVGLGLCVTPAGARSWIFEAKAKTGRSSRVVIARVGRMPLGTRTQPGTVRHHVVELTTALAQGADPGRDRSAARAAPTVATLVAQYLDEHLRIKGKPSTVREFERVIGKDVLPALGSLKVADVARSDVEALHRRVGKRGPRAGNYVLQVVSALFGFAETRDMRPQGSNPAALVKRFPEAKRERFLSAEELARLGDALAAVERDEERFPASILALRLLILTGLRRSEVLGLRWDGVDIERGILTLADSKTGRKRLPLTAPVAALLAGAYREAGNPYVCPGLAKLDEKGQRIGPPRPLATLAHAWNRVRAVAGLKDVPLHSLRHTFASVGAAAGLGLYVVGKVIGHASAGSTGRYAHLGADPVRTAAERIAGEVAASLGGASGELVPFKANR